MDDLPLEILHYIILFNDLTGLYNMMLTCKKYNIIFHNFRILKEVLSNHLPYFKDCEATDINYLKECIAFYQHNKNRETLGTDLKLILMPYYNVIVVPHFLIDFQPFFKKSNHIISIILNLNCELIAGVKNIIGLIQYLQCKILNDKIIMVCESNHLHTQPIHYQNWNNVLTDFETKQLSPISIRALVPTQSHSVVLISDHSNIHGYHIGKPRSEDLHTRASNILINLIN